MLYISDFFNHNIKNSKWLILENVTFLNIAIMRFFFILIFLNFFFTKHLSRLNLIKRLYYLKNKLFNN